jgi:transposase-like protein
MEDDIPYDIQLRYIKHPYFCPYCESTETVVVAPPEAEMDFVTQVIGCKDCERLWTDVYQLTAVEPYVEND